MNSRIRTGIGILLKMSGLALAVTIFMYVLNAHTPFVELRRMFFETLIYANIIAFPSYWVLPRLFLLVSKWSSFVQWTRGMARWCA